MVWKPQKFSPAARYNTTTQLNTTLMYAKKFSRPKGATKSGQNLSYFKILKKGIMALFHNEIIYRNFGWKIFRNI